jgi:hypothetical protein
MTLIDNVEVQMEGFNRGVIQVKTHVQAFTKGLIDGTNISLIIRIFRTDVTYLKILVKRWLIVVVLAVMHLLIVSHGLPYNPKKFFGLDVDVTYVLNRTFYTVLMMLFLFFYLKDSSNERRRLTQRLYIERDVKRTSTIRNYDSIRDTILSAFSRILVEGTTSAIYFIANNFVVPLVFNVSLLIASVLPLSWLWRDVLYAVYVMYTSVFLAYYVWQYRVTRQLNFDYIVDNWVYFLGYCLLISLLSVTVQDFILLVLISDGLITIQTIASTQIMRGPDYHFNNVVLRRYFDTTCYVANLLVDKVSSKLVDRLMQNNRR